MHRAIRRGLFIFFVLLFFLSSAVLLFYANGYRYNTGRNGIEKTGQLLVETEPKGALIYLNNEPATNQWSRERMATPATVPYLFSGKYRLNVTKDGFHDWSDDITIEQGRTVVRNDIILLKKSDPALVSAHVSLTGARKIKDGIVLYEGKSVFFYDEKIGEVRKVFTSPETIRDIRPSPSGLRFAVRGANAWYIVDQEQIVSTIKISKKEEPMLRWKKDEDRLYLYTEKGFAVFDWGRGEFIPLSLIPVKGVLDFFVDSQMVVLRGPEKSTVAFYESVTGAKQKEFSSGPSAKTIAGSENGFLIFADISGSYYLFNRSADRPSFQQVSNAREVIFTTPNHFVTYNDFEIWSHDFWDDRYTRTLITRQSMPFVSVIPLRRMPFVVTASKNGDIRMRDLRESETPQDTLLASFNTITSVAVNEKETGLIIVGSRYSQSGVFTLPIIEQEQLFPLVK